MRTHTPSVCEHLLVWNTTPSHSGVNICDIWWNTSLLLFGVNTLCEIKQSICTFFHSLFKTDVVTKITHERISICCVFFLFGLKYKTQKILCKSLRHSRSLLRKNTIMFEWNNVIPQCNSYRPWPNKIHQEPLAHFDHSDDSGRTVLTICCCWTCIQTIDDKK